MARYRKIDTRIWNDRKFRELDDKSKLAFFLVLTHPDTNQLGMLRSRSVALAMELGWHPDVMSDAILTLCRMDMLMVDDKAGFIFIPNFLKYNPPNGPNAVKGWAGLIDLMPECELLTHALYHLKPFIDGLSYGLRNAIPNDIKDAISHAIPNDIEDAPRIQEQEQEQEQDNTNKQQTEVSEAVEATTAEGVCCVSSDEDVFDEFDFIDTPIKQQVEQVQLEHFNAQDASKPLTLTELIVACKTFGIRLSHTPKTEAIANRKTITLVVLRECVKAWKGTNTGTGYFIGILENASKDPNSILPHDKREKPELSAETITDKQAGYFASRLVKDTSFCSTFGVGHQSFDSFIDQVTRRLHDPAYFNEYLPWMQKHGFV